MRILFSLLFVFLLSFIFPSSPDGGGPYIRWNANQKLTWDDFQGRPDPSMNMMAHTKSRIKMSWQCKNDEFSFSVFARFDKDYSWRMDRVSDKLLRHEQGHFDITEIFARKMRKVLSELEHPCKLQPVELKAHTNAVQVEWKAYQKQYDEETVHSTNEEEQKRWEELIARRLEDSSDYSQK